MSLMNKFARALATALMLSSLAVSAAGDDVSWIADSNGCKIANPFPQPGETVTWSGGCSKGLADGDGVMQWFIDGKPLDMYEGTLKEGWPRARVRWSAKAAAIRASGSTACRTATAGSTRPMAAGTRASGRKASPTAAASTRLPTVA